MLGRTANGVFWMFRYLERAENTARLLDAGFRLALTHGQSKANVEWKSVLETIGQKSEFAGKRGDFSGPAVTNWVLRDKDNSGSVLAMIENARTSARAVRTALTREVWEATNESWMVLRDALARPVKATNLGAVLATIRRHATLVRGAMDGTMLRNEIFNFARIGTFIERADNTARILDVKYYVLLPAVSLVGSKFDNAQWEMVLRSVSGERAYRWLFGANMDARGIASFLMLDNRFPRSLASSYAKVSSNMLGLSGEYGCESPAHDVLRATNARLLDHNIDQIIEKGLHQFIGNFLKDNREMAGAIAQAYRFTD